MLQPEWRLGQIAVWVSASVTLVAHSRQGVVLEMSVLTSGQSSVVRGSRGRGIVEAGERVHGVVMYASGNGSRCRRGELLFVEAGVCFVSVISVEKRCRVDCFGVRNCCARKKWLVGLFA